MWCVSVVSEFVAETFDAELNQIYDILIDVPLQFVSGTEVTVFIEFAFSSLISVW